MDNAVRKESKKSEIEISRVYKSDYQKEGTLTAELKQTVTTKSYYPSKSVSNNMQDNIFGMADFGFEEQKFNNVETRVAWIDVPESSTNETIKAQLAKFPKAELYKVLSNKPIITDAQQYAIDQNIVTLDVFANRQAVRYPAGHPQEGELALDAKGKVQYRAVFFAKELKEDIDYRTEDPSDFYVSSELEAEIQAIGSATVVAEQQL